MSPAPSLRSFSPFRRAGYRRPDRLEWFVPAEKLIPETSWRPTCHGGSLARAASPHRRRAAQVGRRDALDARRTWTAADAAHFPARPAHGPVAQGSAGLGPLQEGRVELAEGRLSVLGPPFQPPRRHQAQRLTLIRTVSDVLTAPPTPSRPDPPISLSDPPNLATPPPENWTKLRGCLRPRDQVVGSEGSEAASPTMSP